MGIAFGTRGRGSANQLNYYDLLSYFYGTLTAYHIPADIPLLYSNLTPQDSLYPILQKAVFYYNFPNYTGSLPLKQTAKEQDLAMLIKVHYQQDILLSGSQLLTFSKLTNTLSPLLKNHREKLSFQLVKSTLQESFLYPEQLPKDEQISNISGYLSSIQDPHTRYYTPAEAKKLMSILENQISGIWAVLSLQDNKVVVEKVLTDSPAEHAVLQKGDILLKIDDFTLQQEGEFEEFIARIRGVEGSTLTLQIQRGDAILQKVLTRAKIQISPLFVHQEAGKCYLQILNFDQGIAKKLAQEVANLTYCWELIIDLRGNPGGIVDEVIASLELFVPAENPLLTWHSRLTKVIQKSQLPARFDQFSFKILIDKDTASAAEIFAGVMKHHFPQKVQLIGQKSYGKGSIQEVISLPNDGMLKYTMALRHIADQLSSLNQKGLNPDWELQDNPNTPQDEALIALWIQTS